MVPEIQYLFQFIGTKNKINSIYYTNLIHNSSLSLSFINAITGFVINTRQTIQITIIIWWWVRRQICIYFEVIVIKIQATISWYGVFITRNVFAVGCIRIEVSFSVNDAFWVQFQRWRRTLHIVFWLSYCWTYILVMSDSLLNG